MKRFDHNDGITVGDDGDINTNGASYAMYMITRAAKFMDIVGYTGNGAAVASPSTQNHNLGVTPELIFAKNLSSGGTNFFVYASALGEDKGLMLNSNNAEIGYNIGFKNVGASTFQTFDSNDSNNADFAAYLFATLAGVSKVGSYTGSASAVNVDCGFTSGARFVLVKRTDDSGNWFTYDTARGINAGADPQWALNNTSAESSSNDDIDPLSSGFSIPSGSNANAVGGNYIFLAIA